MRPAATSSSLFCLALGLAPVQCRVLLLRNLPSPGLSTFSLLICDFLSASPFGGDLRSVEERECWSVRASLWASSLAGDLRVYGRSSSSIVFPRARLDGGVIVRLRTEMLCRCRSLRFCMCAKESANSVHTFDGTRKDSDRWKEPWPLSAPSWRASIYLSVV